MLKQKYFLTDFFILSAEKQPIKLSWRKIVWLPFIVSVPKPYFLGMENVKGRQSETDTEPFNHTLIISAKQIYRKN